MNTKLTILAGIALAAAVMVWAKHHDEIAPMSSDPVAEVQAAASATNLQAAPDWLVEAVEQHTGRTCTKPTWEAAASTKTDFAINCGGGLTGIQFFHVKLGPSGSLRVTQD
jgi:hypothetical protein